MGRFAAKLAVMAAVEAARRTKAVKIQERRDEAAEFYSAMMVRMMMQPVPMGLWPPAPPAPALSVSRAADASPR